MRKIAIWGFGYMGRDVFRTIREYYPSIDVTAIYDANPQGIDAMHVPAGMRVQHVDELCRDFGQGRFEAVFITVFDQTAQAQIKSKLHGWGIGYLGIDDLIPPCDAISLDETMRRELAGDDTIDIPARIMARMQDECSVELFQTRLILTLYGNQIPFLEAVERWSGEFTYVMPDLTRAMERLECTRVVLFGGGSDGNVNLHALALCQIPLAALCSLDGNSPGRAWPQDKSHLVMSSRRLLESAYDDCLVIVSCQEDRFLIQEHLADLGFPDDRVFDPPCRYRPILTGYRPDQYFDIWEPVEHEVFVDCGAYDGNTSIDFVRWCKGCYDRIYALEPLPSFKGVIEQKAHARSLHDVTLIEAAAWNRSETLSFSVSPVMSGSAIVEDGASSEVMEVRGVALDDVVEPPITFLKMDIEGSELAAIDGAENLIRTCRPRLAISIYHKPFDVLDLPRRILEIVPEYRFAVRHYGAGLFETVLYAWVDDGFPNGVERDENGR